MRLSTFSALRRDLEQMISLAYKDRNTTLGMVKSGMVWFALVRIMDGVILILPGHFNLCVILFWDILLQHYTSTQKVHKYLAIFELTLQRKNVYMNI
jgi:hypothetical protein